MFELKRIRGEQLALGEKQSLASAPAFHGETLQNAPDVHPATSHWLSRFPLAALARRPLPPVVEEPGT